MQYGILIFSLICQVFFHVITSELHYNFSGCVACHHMHAEVYTSFGQPPIDRYLVVSNF